MAILDILIEPTVPHQLLRVDLDGRECQLDVRWNARAGAWFLAISDATGARIASGVKIVVGSPLLRRLADSRKPPGDLVATDTAGGDRDAGAEELGGRVVLRYFEDET